MIWLAMFFFVTSAIIGFVRQWTKWRYRGWDMVALVYFQGCIIFAMGCAVMLGLDRAAWLVPYLLTCIVTSLVGVGAGVVCACFIWMVMGYHFNDSDNH